MKMGKYELRNTILDVLLRIDRDSGYSHLLLDHEIKKHHFSEKDAALLTEVVYGTIQRKLTLEFIVNNYIEQKKKLEHWVKMLLAMSVYQMVFLDKIPDHAIIHEAVEIAKRRGHRGIASLVNGVLRSVQRKGVPDTAKIKDDMKRLSVETSHPEWLVKRWTAFYGYETAKKMSFANLEHKLLSVRIQPLKIDREEAIGKLEQEGFQVERSIFSNQGIIFKKGNGLRSSLFKEGMLTVQDQSSMLAGELLDVRPGMNVLDACSAPGGKATHIAEKMQNQGLIKAYDLHPKKIKLIEKKAAELNLTIIDAQAKDARKLQEEHEGEFFDRILVDAPCSGLGVIRGKPDIKYNKKEADIFALAEIQLTILNRVADLLKIGGLLMYSTCTVDPVENEEVVKMFLQNHKNYAIDSRFFQNLPDALESTTGISEYGLQLFPHTFQTDGFFLTRLIRNA